ncbi:DUF4038 domain-containing protein [bacterium]|nr:DUF4038 domain-containing protein [bacterium]
MSQTNPETLPLRTVGEWTLTSERTYKEPFVDVTVDVTFHAPSGQALTIPAFYAGDGIWRVRFNPGETGQWTFQAHTRPADASLMRRGEFTVSERQTDGFLMATPGDAFGFRFESGKPLFIVGDTTYNLFGAAHCDLPVDAFMERRAAQGFNLLRVRVPVSPFHPPEGYSHWQTKRTWAWGGSEQAPRFDRFNLDYFATVDRVVQKAEDLELGLEMIMEAWGFEFPFNSRQIFLPEWEELWMRYLIARYDAYNCLYFWTPLNEYEYYPNGDWHYKSVSDRWAIRIARWIKATAPHGHVIAMHNGPRLPAFAKRFAADPEAVDAVMFQEWGSNDRERGWLAAGIEETIAEAFAGWTRSIVFAEYAYERNPTLPLVFTGHEFSLPEHMRRAPWRGAFQGMGIIHGFENTWGPFAILEEDQPSLPYVQHLKRFFTEIVDFDRLRPAPQLLQSGPNEDGYTPLMLATEDRSQIAVYVPAGGEFALKLPVHGYAAQWYDPRSGELTGAAVSTNPNSMTFSTPGGTDDEGHPWDWALVLVKTA